MRSTVVEFLRTFAAEFDARLDAYLQPTPDAPSLLVEAMRYAALAPGKRIRPYVVVRCCELCGGPRETAWPVAAAIECVHAFSLVHDDLPAIDNDDLRRGRPTCHRKFDEATAILAGDALLVRAYELIASAPVEAERVRRLVATLAEGAGWQGMIGGEFADVAGEGEPASLERTRFIHERKTGSLIAAACRMGALVGGGESTDVDRLGRFGLHLGLAFQIADDLLDATSSETAVGKATRKDEAAGKQTYPRCLGIASSRLAAEAAVAACRQELEPFRPAADDLAALAGYVLDRNY